MLGINVNINADIRVGNYHYPIKFNNQNICVHCGSENEMRFVDKFGKDSSHLDLYPVQHIRCTHCGRNYGIQWDPQDNGSMLPTAVEPSISNMFKNLIAEKAIKAIGEKVLENLPSI